MIRRIVLGVVLFAAAQSASAQVQECVRVYYDATRDLVVDQRNQLLAREVFDTYCESNGSVRQSSGSITGEIFDILNFDVGGSTASESTSQFCSTYAESFLAADNSYALRTGPNVDALRSFNDCVRLAREDLLVYHTDSHPISASVLIRVLNNDLEPTLEAIEYDPLALTCYTGPKETSSPVLGIIGQQIEDELTVVCERIATQGVGIVRYQRTPVTVTTSQGQYSFVLQADGQYSSLALLSDADAQIQSLQSENSQLLDQVVNLTLQLQTNDEYSVFVVGPGLTGALAMLPKYVRRVGCLRPQAVQDAVIAEQMRLACEPGYEPSLIGEVSHAGGGACGQTAVQINCIRRAE